MRRRGSGRLWLLVAATAAIAAPAEAASPPAGVRVEAGGSLPDALAHAAALRAAAPRRPVRIEIGPGTFRLGAPLHIGADLGGTAAAPLVIQGAPGGGTRLVGSLRLEPVATMPPAAILARIPAAARPHVRFYRLPAAALEAPSIQRPRTLTGERDPVALEVFDETGALRPARYPNSGWAAVAPDPKAPSFNPGVSRAQLERWRAEPDLWAEGYWRWDWLFEAFPVDAVRPEAGRLGLSDTPYEGIKAAARFRIAHALSELDEPGEWWRDRADGLLVAWPRPGHEALDISVTDTLIAMEGASHIRLENLRLEQARGDLLTVRGGGDVTVRHSAIAWAAGIGALFEGVQGGGLADCDVTDTGRAAVAIEGGDRPTLRSGGLSVRDSRITRYARLSETQNPGIAAGGVGATLSGNVIHDAGGPAIVLRGNDHRVTGNEIAHVLSGASDAGAIYSGRDWTARGTVIAGNFLHDIRADPGFEVKGVYLDDEASGFTVRDNLFLRVDQAVFLGGGRDNVVSHNLFVASNPAIHVDSRGQTWAANAIADPESELRQAYAAMPVGSALRRARYPGLATVLQNSPAVARNNTLAGNAFVLSQPFHFDDGGEARQQVIRDNRGPDGIGQGVPDLPALAATSIRPEDFAGLLPGLDLSGMNRAARPAGLSGPTDR